MRRVVEQKLLEIERHMAKTMLLEEIEHAFSVQQALLCKHGDDGCCYPMLAQQIGSTHRFGVSAGAISPMPLQVMYVCWPIETDANADVFFFEEPTPFVVD